MDPNQETENSEYSFELSEDDAVDESTSVDDFIKELEAKEKDLHITAETTFIEIAADFEDGELPDFLKQDTAEKNPVTVAPAVTKSAASNPSGVTNFEQEIAQLKSKITTMETERLEFFEKSQRRSKDFDAYKARTERERGDTFQKQLRNLATQMLPALDNLDRALKFACDMSDEQRNEIVQFFDGIVLVNQQVNEVLAGMGIMPIATVGHIFDPHVHEAVAIEENTDLPPNTISQELLRGFRIGDNVIRHAMVKVSQPSLPSEPPKKEAADGFDDIVFLDDTEEMEDNDDFNDMTADFGPEGLIESSDDK
jgi:molecular chaperone GrpE